MFIVFVVVYPLPLSIGRFAYDQTNQNHNNHTKNSALHKTQSVPIAAGGGDAEVEHLRKKLMQSFTEIDELKTMVQQLSIENYQLKARIDPTDTFDVPL